MKSIYILLSSIILFLSCNNTEEEATKSTEMSFEFTKIEMNLDSTHFRGLNMISSKDVWITGTDGVFLHFDGEIWSSGKIDSAKGLDLRDVHALAESEAITVAAGSPGKIFKTDDCGLTWREVYSNYDSLIFFDGFDFTNDGRGVVFGDPMNGKIKMMYTNNEGDSWSDFDSTLLPNALNVEAGFAASGTGVKLFDSSIYIGLGGEKSRFLHSVDFGKTWIFVETPMLHGSGGKGIYTMAFKDKMNGVAAGGNWEDPECDSSKIYTNDGGLTWYLSEGLQHYRSCVTHVKDDVYMSTGTTGTDISYDNGKTWKFLDSAALNAIQFDSKSNKGFGVGSFGKIYQINVFD